MAAGEQNLGMHPANTNDGPLDEGRRWSWQGAEAGSSCKHAIRDARQLASALPSAVHVSVVTQFGIEALKQAVLEELEANSELQATAACTTL